MKDFSAKAYKQQLKEKGVFHTDKRLAKIMRKYAKENPREVYDPTCGNGVLLSVFDDEVPKYGQELEEAYLEDASNHLINFTGACGDTLKEPAFMGQKFDCILANTPFSVKWDGNAEDVRFKDWPCLPPKSKADYAFLMHILYMLADDGVAVSLHFPGVLYRGARERRIREELVRRGYIKRIVRVPGGYFEDTKIETALLVLSKEEGDRSIIFEDLDLKKERKVPFEEIEENDFDLAVSHYVFEEIQKKEIDPVDQEVQIRNFLKENLKKKLKTHAFIAELDETIPDFNGFLDELIGMIQEFKK